MDAINVVKCVKDARAIIKTFKKEGRTLGFVPTMGYFHDGHINLMKRSLAECDETFVSIFVNPIQFGPNEDFSRYPRDLDRDCSMAFKAGVKYIFFPDAAEMYPERFQTRVTAGDLSRNFCGASRPGHFDGVCTVVSKLFNIIMPDRAYFGMKDYQQLAVIKKMAEDLNFDIEIIGCETTREPDGLAMSSRNAYLSPENRLIAPIFNEAFRGIKLEIEKKIKSNAVIDSGNLIAACEEKLLKSGFNRIDYIKIADADTLVELKDQESFSAAKKIFIAGAVILGKTRLIDNIVFGKDDDAK